MGSIWWYSTRAAGLVAWGLLSASVIAGLLLSGRATGRRLRPNWLTDLHRGLSGLAVAFAQARPRRGDRGGRQLHVHFGVADVLLPLASGWKPLAVAWGIVSMYLLVAVEATSLLRRRLTKKQWRAVHVLKAPAVPLRHRPRHHRRHRAGHAGRHHRRPRGGRHVAGLTTYRVLDARERARHVLGAPEAAPTG